MRKKPPMGSAAAAVDPATTQDTPIVPAVDTVVQRHEETDALNAAPVGGPALENLGETIVNDANAVAAASIDTVIAPPYVATATVVEGARTLEADLVDLRDPAVVVAEQLVQGIPNADLVEAVRRVLAGEVAPAPVPTAEPADVSYAVLRANMRLGHAALMDLKHNGQDYAPFHLVFVTEAEFVPLRAAQVFGGFWDEGVEEA
jgi:hypothetical protein